MLDRKDAPINQTWDLSLLFKTLEDFELAKNDYKKYVDDFVNKYEGNLNTVENIKLALKNYRDILEKGSKLGTYCSLAVEANVFDKDASKRYAAIRSVLAAGAAKLSFLESELLQLDLDLLRDASKNEEDRVYIEELIKLKPHTLSKEVEKALKALSNTIDYPYQAYNDIKFRDLSFDSFDVNGKSYDMTYNTFEDRYQESSDKDLRRKAFEQFEITIDKYKNSTASAYNAQIQKEKTLANLRGYESVIDYLLEDQDVSRDLYNRQMDVIMEELASHMRRYAKLLKKIHKLDKMTYADLKIEVDPTFSPEISFEEAKKYIIDGLDLLGPEYKEILLEAFENRWIDYAETKGKRTGAFCSSPYGANSFILMAFNDSMSDCMTLAHELGHAGHFQLAHKNQNILNSRPSLYFIEAPSTTNELLVENHLLDVAEEKGDLRMKRWVLSQMVSKTYYHNFVTHFMEAYYQREVYKLVDQGQSLDADTLTEIFENTLKKFWGDEVELTPGAGLTWMRQPHYYMGLYPYTYSAGLTIGTQMCKKLRNEGPEVAENWVRVLKLGGTMGPEQLSKEAMVDVSSDQPLKDTISYIGKLINEIEELTEKLN